MQNSYTMRRVISVMSGKGGVGKTFLTLNLGLSFHDFEEDSTVVDADLQNPNLGLHLGFYDYTLTLHDALSRGINILDVVHLHHTGLKIIPASMSLEYLYTNPERLQELMNELEGYVLIDAAPGLGREVVSTLKASNDVLLVTNPEITSVTDCIRTAELARTMKKALLGVVVNRRRGRGYEIPNGEIEEAVGAPVIGVIPEDENVKKSIAAGKPIVRYSPHSKASISVKRIAAGILEKEYSPGRLLFLKQLFR